MTCQFELDIGPDTAKSTVESTSKLDRYRLSILLVSRDRFVCIPGNAHANVMHVGEPLNRKIFLSVVYVLCIQETLL
jgi:hypothetical protein